MKRIIIYPILFSVFPILSLYVSSMSQVLFQEAVAIIMLSILFTVLLLLVTFIILKDIDKASITTSLFVLLFFSHSHFLSLFYIAVDKLMEPERASVIFESEVVPILWLCLWLALFVFAFFAIAKSSRDLRPVSRFLNAVAFALTAAVAVNWFYVHSQASSSRDYMAKWASDPSSSDLENIARTTPESHPDIYYIILDGYARSEVLEEIYNVDNSKFLSYLAEKGFYVANRSQSNYSQTALSLASSMNFTYLDDLVKAVGSESDNRLPLREMIRNSRLFQYLDSYGYITVGFPTGYSLTEPLNADQYLSPKWNLGEFQGIFIDRTPIPILLELPFLETRYDLHRERMLFTLDHLADSADIDLPTFVFAHIIAPHPPFVFGPEGEPLQPSHSLALGGGFTLGDGNDYLQMAGKVGYVKGYRDQLTYITKRVQTALNDILDRSPTPPIIILQADHGPGSMLDWNNMQDSNLAERMSILNAYYFPDRNYTMLYPEISPVNTFRVLLNRYFDANLELLEDRSYFSSLDRPYRFVEVLTETTSP